MNYAIYQPVESVNGKGTFFYTGCCGKTLYSVKDETAYHGKLCPCCLRKHIYTTLYMEGTEEANRIADIRGDNNDVI